MDWNLNTDQCTGCSACSDVCPVSAITMEVDASGSRRPQLNNALCISCSKCKRVCPQFTSTINREGNKDAFIGICIDAELYLKSSSGGIFAALATSFLQRGGIVYGAAMVLRNNRLNCQHLRIADKNDLHLIQGSKYVQSKMDGIYKAIKEDLKRGKQVLFSGTSCQVAALKNNIGDNDNLFTIDLVCHGVPKDSLFDDYINYIESQYNVRIENVSFRIKGYKSFWNNSSFVLKFWCKGKRDDRIIFIPSNKSAYYKLFLQRAGYRESCYTCKYASLNKVADITLGDFRPTSIEYKRYSLQRDNTYSSILIHTLKGEKLFDRVGGSIYLISIPIKEIINHHLNLQKPSSMTSRGAKLLEIYRQEGFASLQNQINKTYWMEQLWLLLKKKLKKVAI